MRKSRDELARMGSEELKEILRLDSQGVEEYPTEDILYMLELIVHREKTPEEIQAETAAAWSRFQRDYLRPEGEAHITAQIKTVRRWRLPRGLGATAAALVLAFVGMLTARAAGWDILGGLAKWNDEIFTFGSLDTETPVEGESVESTTVSGEPSKQPELLTPEVLEYDTLQEALDACGITEVKAPTWLPKGSQFQTAERICNSDGTLSELYAKYECQGELLVINILPSDQSSAYVEKVEGNAGITDIHGQMVYIIENIHDYTMAWKTSGYECYLSGSDQQILEQMAASMLN